jgi:hypothetical protein
LKLEINSEITSERILEKARSILIKEYSIVKKEFGLALLFE